MQLKNLVPTDKWARQSTEWD